MPVDPKLVRDVFLAAVELPPPDRHRVFIDHCGSDDELHAAKSSRWPLSDGPPGSLE